MRVYWLEQSEADVPADDNWLSANETDRLLSLRVPKRRNDWRLGRWTAKRAVAAYLDRTGSSRALTSIQILPAASGAPEVFLQDRTPAPSISLSHRGGIALCTVAEPHVTLGCDLEMIEPRDDNFVTDYFTADEQALISRVSPVERFQLLALLWSAKESGLKALRTGLRLDTRRVEVRLPGLLSEQLPGGRLLPEQWRVFEVRCPGDQALQGWWRQTGNFLRTIVANPPTPVLPHSLEGSLKR